MCCKTHGNGSMNVAWDSCWGGSILPCKVAAAGDKGQLVCAASAAAIVSSVIGSSFWCSAIRGCTAHCNGCMDVRTVLQNTL